MPSAAELLREGIWDELLHPRAEAGSAGGGQFTSGGSHGGGKRGHAHISKGSGGGKGKHPKAPAKLLAYNPKTNTGPGYNMPHGDPRVHQLQEALIRFGITDAHGKALVDDGKLGPLTTQAIQAAQTKLGLKPTGRVTPALLTRLVTAKSLTPGRKPKAVHVPKPRRPRARRVRQSVTAAEVLFGSAAVAALESWEEMLHPRGPGGKFAALGTEERETRRKARNEARRTARAAAKTGGTAAKAAKSATRAVEKPHTHESILAHASTMSDEDLAKLHTAIAEMHHARQAKAAASAVPEPAAHSFVPSGHGLNGPMAGAEPTTNRFMAKYHTAMSQGEYAKATDHLHHAAMSTEDPELERSLTNAAGHIARNAPSASGPAHNPEEHRQLAAAHTAAAGDSGPRGATHEDLVHAAYQGAPHDPVGYVMLSDLRNSEHLKGIPRSEVDRVLIDMDRKDSRVHIAPESNQKTLSPEERAGALRLGGQDQHMIRIAAPVDEGAHDRVRAGGVASASDADLENARRSPGIRSALYDEIRAEQKRRAASPTPAIREVPVPASVSPRTRAKAEKMLAAPDVNHHAVQLDMLRAQLAPGNLEAPIDAATKYVAGVKGAELTALAKHLGTGGRTAAEKRRNIIQARLGMLGDAMAIHPHGYAGGSR